jgi:hypothetical protein
MTEIESTLCQATEGDQLCILMAGHESDHEWRYDSSIAGEDDE